MQRRRQRLSTSSRPFGAPSASSASPDCHLLRLPEDVLIRAFSRWPAASIANTAITCRELHTLLAPAVDAAAAQLQLPLPPRCHTRAAARGGRAHDSLTRRLNFLQKIAARQPALVAAGHASTLLATSPGGGVGGGGAGAGAAAAEHRKPPAKRSGSSNSASNSASNAASAATELYYWGSSGGDEENIHAILPTPVAGLPSSIAIREVAAGDSHCLLLSAREHDVYSWGSDNTYGQLGHGTTVAQPRPKRIDALTPHRCMQVACGRQHSLVLTAEGVVHSFGRGALGRLGLGGTDDVYVPLPLLHSGRLPKHHHYHHGGSSSSAAAGLLHAASFADELTLLESPSSSSFAPVLPAPFSASSPMTGSTHISYHNHAGGGVHALPHGALLLPRFVMITAGLFHSMAVSEDGALYTWGSGTNGRLGHGDTVMQLRPRRVEALSHVNVLHASAGSGHSVAVSDAGKLYTWGQGYSGRLGHGNQETKPQPALVEAMDGQHVTSAVAGCEFTLAITSKGALYAFGNGDMTGTVWYGRGWEGGADRMLLPARVHSLCDVTVSEVAAGSCHTILRGKLPPNCCDHRGDGVSHAEEVFTFGSGAQGQLGHGNLDEQLVPKRLELGIGGGAAGVLSSPQSPMW